VSSGVSGVLDEILRDEPARVALVAPDRSVTYAELDGLVDRAVGALLELGLTAGDRIAVSLPNDSRIVVLFHAAMRIGAVWVGIGRGMTAQERDAILADCRPRLCVGAGTTRHGGVVLSEDDWAARLTVATSRRIRGAADPHAPAAIAYTSGTTGSPKGVVHSQHNLLLPGAMLSATRGYGRTLRKADCLPMTTVNMLVLSTLTTCQAGGTAIISDFRRARPLAEWLQGTRATVWNGVPTLLYDLLRDDAIDRTALSGLVDLWSGGDDLSEDLRDAFSRTFALPIHGTYGLTEAPAVVAIEDLGAEHVPGSSGRVLPHLRVVTEKGGELCVGAATDGPYAGRYTPMLGYWETPEATAETLADGVLRTGDLGTVGASGDLFVRGRRKLVISRGGANVYPAEVEGVVAMADGVVACAVVGVPDERLGSRIGIVVQTDDTGRASAEALREQCAPALSRYKVPELWQLTTEAIPRNSMGKIDRRRVRDMAAYARLVGGQHP
jgi:long-chain acyl-CoA synthetase